MAGRLLPKVQVFEKHEKLGDLKDIKISVEKDNSVECSVEMVRNQIIADMEAGNVSDLSTL